MSIIKRADKGSALNYNEMDANFDAIAPRDSATGAIEIPVGTTGQQPASPIVGQLRFNIQLNLFEGYFDSVGWTALSASGVSGEVNQSAWAEIAVVGQSNVAADQASDLLTFIAGTNISIITDAAADSITFNNTFTQDFAYSSLTGTPTTISGYGITDAFDGAYASLTGTPSTFAPSAHNQAWSTITSTPTTISGYGITDAFDGAYSSLTGTPSTFAPSAHNQAWSTITSTPTTIAGYGITDAFDGAYASLTGTPSTFAPSAHNQAWSTITSTPTTIAGYGITDAFDGAYATLTGTPTNISTFTNDSGYLTSETTTTLIADSANTKLVYTDETGTANDVDLSWAVDDTNLARITSGTVNGGTGVATFTRDDATTFTIDFSALFDDTNLTRITSGSVSGSTMTLNRSDATTVSVDVSSLLDNTDTIDYINAASFNTTTGVLSLTGVGGAGATVDLDGRYLTSVPAQSFASLTGTPTTINDYGITDAFDGVYSSLTGTPSTFTPSAHNQAWSTITSTPTTVAGYGITDAGISNVVEDTTPQLGGNLDLNGNEIQNNGNIILHPTSSGGYVGVNSTTASGGKLVLNADQIGTPSSSGTNWSYIEVERGNSLNVNIRWNEGTDKWEFTNNGSTYSPLGGSSYANSDVDAHLNVSGASTNEVLSWTGSDYTWVAQSAGGIASVVEDTTPQLGGNLDLNGNEIQNNGNIILHPTSSGGYVGVNSTTASGGKLVLNADQAGSPAGSGTNWSYIEVERGVAPNVNIRWNEGTDKWQFTNNGSTYYDFVIADTDTGILSVIEDTTPELGGDLNVNGNKITSIGTYGTVPIEVNSNSVATELVKFGYDPINPTTPDANRYGTTFTDKVWIKTNSNQTFDLYDIVTDTADITSDAGIYMSFKATDGQGAVQTRSSIYHQNNMLRITSHDKDDVSPQTNYLQLTLRPTLLSGGFTISSVVDSVATNYDVVTDQNIENKVFYSIFQPTESSNTLRHANYTTTERNALIAGAGTVIWNTTDSKLQVYNGSSWENLH